MATYSNIAKYTMMSDTNLSQDKYSPFFPQISAFNIGKFYCKKYMENFVINIVTIILPTRGVQI